MDVNGLKYANDTFGHQAGDELIKAAANAIKKAFGASGNCFRIGGDEFAVITHAPLDLHFHLYSALQNNIKEYNKKALYHLSIAVGKSRLHNDSGTRKSISDWKMEADLNMYRDKVRYHKPVENHARGHEQFLVGKKQRQSEPQGSSFLPDFNRGSKGSLYGRPLRTSEGVLGTDRPFLRAFGKFHIVDYACGAIARYW